MDSVEREQFTKLIQDFSKKSDALYSRLIKWAEKFGGLAESTKRDLKTIADKLNAPFYKTWDFWKLILQLAVFAIGIILVIRYGGCFYINGLVELGKCKSI